MMPGAPGLAHEAGKVVGRALRAPWTTPRRLVGFRMFIWIFTGLLFFAGESALGRSRAALQTIARDTAPSIVLAEQTGAALADLDANVANALLGKPEWGAAVAADAAIEKQRLAATAGLVKSAENITNGDAERGPLGAMIVDFGRYLEREAQARLLHSRGEEAPAKAAYWAATDILHRKILAAADQLDGAKKEQMDVAYASELEANSASEIVASGFGLLLIGTLVWAQWFLFRRMRRILNVPLLVATLAGFVLVVYLVHAFSDTRENLRIAKLDAFDSIYVLVRARSLAYDANGDESRYLLDPSQDRGLDGDFRRKVQKLTDDPALTSRSSVPLAAANPKSPHVLPQNQPKITGALWDALRNITFPGEYEAARDTLRAFASYYAIDTTIRALKGAGKDADAIELSIGSRPDEAKAAFDRFDQALQKTLDVNQAAFDRAVRLTEAELKRAEFLDPGLTLLIALSGWLGIRQRLKEYRA